MAGSSDDLNCLGSATCAMHVSTNTASTPVCQLIFVLVSNARCGENAVKSQLPRRKMWGKGCSGAKCEDRVALRTITRPDDFNGFIYLSLLLVPQNEHPYAKHNVSCHRH
jgi:hypothetical protein